MPKKGQQKQQRRANNGPQMNQQRRRVRRRNRAGQMPRNQENVLIPSGVNNRATMPVASQNYSLAGEEVIAIYTAPDVAEAGHKIFNVQVSHDSVNRLSLLSKGFQRVKWHQCHLHLVALNGSTTTSGYTAGFFEDPEIAAPPDGSAVIPTLTALRTTAVRQNWVESTTGMILKLADLPEMYVTPGSDVRRFAIGRFVAALTGSPGPNTTFQLMLKYHVTLSVPQAAVVGGITPTDEYLVPNNVNPGSTGNFADTGPAAGTPLSARDSIPVTSSSPLPPAGEWLCPGGAGFIELHSAGTSTYTPGLDFENATDLMEQQRDNYNWQRVYSIVVGTTTTTWDEVLYRGDDTTPPRAWTSGQRITPLVVTAGLNNRGYTVPAGMRGFQPTPFPVSEGGPALWPLVLENTRILRAGDVLVRAPTTMDVIDAAVAAVEREKLASRVEVLESLLAAGKI